MGGCGNASVLIRAARPSWRAAIDPSARSEHIDLSACRRCVHIGLERTRPWRPARASLRNMVVWFGFALPCAPRRQAKALRKRSKFLGSLMTTTTNDH